MRWTAYALWMILAAALLVGSSPASAEASQFQRVRALRSVHAWGFVAETLQGRADARAKYELAYTWMLAEQPKKVAAVCRSLRQDVRALRTICAAMSAAAAGRWSRIGHGIHQTKIDALSGSLKEAAELDLVWLDAQAAWHSGDILKGNVIHDSGIALIFDHDLTPTQSERIARLYLARGAAARQSGDGAAALKAFKAAYRYAPDHADTAFELGRANQSQGLLMKAHRLDPSWIQPIWLAASLACAASNWGACSYASERIVAMDPSHREANFLLFRSEVESFWEHRRRRRGRHDPLQFDTTKLKRARKFAGQTSDFKLLEARYFEAVGKTREAGRAYRAIFRSGKASVEALLEAATHLISTQQEALAFEAFEAAFRGDRSSPKALLEASELALNGNDRTHALRLLERVNTTFPMHAGAWLSRARIEHAMGRFAAARRHYQHIFELETTGLQRNEARAALSQLDHAGH